MCLLDLLQGKGEERDAVGMSCTLFGIAVIGANVERRGEDLEKKFFIDNAAQAQIPSGDISLP